MVLAKTVCRCVAAGCSNTHKDGVHLFLFPKEARLKKKWTDQVRRTRDKWQPTQHSVLCSKHFEAHCFKPSLKLSESIGMKKIKTQLEAGAISTLFDKTPSLKKPCLEESSDKPVAKKRKRSAYYDKREHLKVSFNIVLKYLNMYHIAKLLKMIEPLILSDGGCSREEANPETNCNNEMVCLQKKCCK